MTDEDAKAVFRAMPGEDYAALTKASFAYAAQEAERASPGCMTREGACGKTPCHDELPDEFAVAYDAYFAGALDGYDQATKRGSNPTSQAVPPSEEDSR